MDFYAITQCTTLYKICHIIHVFSQNINDFFSFHIFVLSEFVQFNFSFAPIIKGVLNINKHGKMGQVDSGERGKNCFVKINSTDIFLNMDPILLHPWF